MSDELMSYDEALERFDPVLGLEVHVELNTATKMFCGCPTEFGAEPNTQVCPVCLGLPGAMPVVNVIAVESAIRIGLALNCEIAEWCRFARKNYFYPDMPKNFQTSQYDEPIAFDGWTRRRGRRAETYRVEIERAHMEEDTGKSLHVGGATGRIHGADYSLVDYNRAGIPLIEIVTKPIDGHPRAGAPRRQGVRRPAARPDARPRRLRRPDGAGLAALRRQPVAAPRRAPAPLGTRTETKNVNSLRSVERAVRYEIGRHAAVLSAGGSILQETRHWHEDTGVTTSAARSPTPRTTATSPSPTWCRSRRRASGSRSCADPARAARGAPQEVAGVLGLHRPRDARRRRRRRARAGRGDDRRRRLAAGRPQVVARRARPPRQRVRDRHRGARPVSPADVARVQALVDEGRINDKLARQVFDGLVAGEGTPDEVVAGRGLAEVSDEGALTAAVDTAIAANPDVADKIRDGRRACRPARRPAVRRCGSSRTGCRPAAPPAR